ncbi:MAG: Ig-like domain-containing protein [Gemmatimonadota bacterium]
MTVPSMPRLRPCHPGALLVLVVLVACSENPTGNEQPSPTTVVVSAASLSFSAIDDTARVSATVLDQNGDPLSGASVVWSSSDPGVATVSGSGLVTARGNGMATVTAASGDARGTVGVEVEQVAVRLRFAPDPVTLPEVGDTVTVVASRVDANDHPMPTGAVTWMSDAPDTVSVSPLGVVTAEAEGSTRLSAEADGFTGELAAFVGNAVVVIGSVSPSPVVAGDTAIIRGLGFDPDPAANDVTLDGFDATVASASSVELRVVVPDADCSPAREAWVRVAARGMADSTTAPVHPGSVVTLAAGEGVYAEDGCLHLAAADGDAEYVVGILSASETPSSLTPAALAARIGSRSVTLATAPAGVARSGSPGTSVKTFSSPFGGAPSAGSATTAAPAPGSALRSPDHGPAWLDRSGEARIRAAERAWLESLGPITPGPRRSPSGAPPAAPPVLNDTLDINIPDFENAGGACEAGSGTPVEAVVRYVGQSVAFLEDVDNPSGGFTRGEYEAFDDFLTATTMDVITDYFGNFEDVDENEVVLVLLSQEVNKRENLAGFVFSGDLAPLAGFQCAAGNDAELFYGLAPDSVGNANPDRPITKDQLELIYPPLIAHELTHVLQFTAAFTTSGVIQSSWQLEGGATLAEQLVGYEVFDHGPRQNLGPSAWNAGADIQDDVPDWYRDWVVDMAFYFGFQGNDPPLAAAPEECSWIGREDEGNTGPCENRRAVYGVPSTLLRWVLDLGGSDELDDVALMRQMTFSSSSGLETLEGATGADRLDLLVPFAVTLWADGNPALPAGEQDWFESWNIYGIYDALSNQDAGLRPYTSSAPAPDLEVAVRAASSAYLEWTAPSDHAPTSLRIRAPADGGLLPEHMILWVLRVQ